MGVKERIEKFRKYCYEHKLKDDEYKYINNFKLWFKHKDSDKYSDRHYVLFYVMDGVIEGRFIKELMSLLDYPLDFDLHGCGHFNYSGCGDYDGDETGITIYLSDGEYKHLEESKHL